MAALTTFAIAGLATAAVGGALQADAQYKAGRAEKRAAMIEAANEETATRQSDLEAREQIERMRLTHRRALGTTRARIAGAGVVGTTGSPLEILGEQAALQELEIQDAARAASTAYTAGFAQAAETRRAGKKSLTAGKRASAATYIQTGANLATSYATGVSQGLIPKFGG